MYPPPVALSPALPSELLSYVLTHHSYPTTLIICQPRAAFLTSLLRCVPHALLKRHAPAPPPLRHLEQDIEDDLDIDRGEENEQEGGYGEGGEGGDADQEPERHHLLIPTLHQIATSRNINLVYTSSVSHLRAYLSVFSSKVEQEQRKAPLNFTKTGTKVPLLVIYGLVESHRHTSEWSAQGLCVTISGLVDAGNRVEMKVVLIEELDWAFEPEDEGVRREYVRRVWEERVPILNGSVRRVGFESDEGLWSGRTLEVGRVLSRWFTFERVEWDAQ